ncbi:MAG: Nuclease [Flaviaesturariibacter sp.]|nr:Nuclease [Flaviaesturariibacter sp.]
MPRSFAWGPEGHALIGQLAFRLLSHSTQQRVQKALGGGSLWDAGIEGDHPTLPTGGQSIAAELERIISRLRHDEDGSSAQLRATILLLTYLVGDLHQPFRAGSNEAVGTARVSWKGTAADLATIWQTKLIPQQEITLKSLDTFYRSLQKDIVQQIGTVNVSNWLLASRSTLAQVGDYGGTNVDEAYAAKCKLAVTMLLTAASIRLASVLEEVFK